MGTVTRIRPPHVEHSGWLGIVCEVCGGAWFNAAVVLEFDQETHRPKVTGYTDLSCRTCSSEEG